LRDVNITTGWAVPSFPVPFPDGFSTGIFTEIDLSSVPEEARSKFEFSFGSILAFLEGADGPPPQEGVPFPPRIKLETVGTTLKLGYFYNTDSACAEAFKRPTKVDGIKFFFGNRKRKMGGTGNKSQD